MTRKALMQMVIDGELQPEAFKIVDATDVAQENQHAKEVTDGSGWWYVFHVWDTPDERMRHRVGQPGSSAVLPSVPFDHCSFTELGLTWHCKNCETQQRGICEAGGLSLSDQYAELLPKLKKLMLECTESACTKLVHAKSACKERVL